VSAMRPRHFLVSMSMFIAAFAAQAAFDLHLSRRLEDVYRRAKAALPRSMVGRCGCGRRARTVIMFVFLEDGLTRCRRFSSFSTLSR
jgi:hypothetical protein